MGVERVTAAHFADPALAAVNAHPFTGEFGRRYYPAVFGDRRRDESFAVAENGEARMLVTCTTGEGVLDWYGMPIQFFARAGATIGAMAIDAALAHLDALAKEHGAAAISLRETPLVALAEPCRRRGYSSSEHDFAYANLTNGEADLRKGLRKRFKSFINWGKRSMAIETVDREHANRDVFRRYQDFHFAIAGRTTRPQASWDAMYDWIAAGRGELILASLEGALIGGTMVVDGADTAYYASGVYDRARFDKPLAHWPLWLGMLHASERGMRLFDIGEVPREGAASSKEVNIGYFKSGFATDVVTSRIWRRGHSATDSQ